MNKIFITGANGFVGKSLTTFLKKKEISFFAGTRSVYGDIASQNNWEQLLEDCNVVVHLAARVHIMEEKNTDSLQEFRKVNVLSTLNLAKAAKKVGVKRFIYLSSVKVNGEQTYEKPFSADDLINPQDNYGVSKAEAEQALMALHETGVFEVVIIRPPLIYGPDVKANLERLFWLVKKGFPLPFGNVKNKRSLVSVFNLCDLILECSTNKNAAGEVFLVSDDQDYSLKDLILSIASIEKKSILLVSMPVALMKVAAISIGKKSFSDRLFGNLHVDITKTKKLLGWTPHFNFENTFKN